MIILDTNVLSEALKPAPSQAVLGWLAGQQQLSVFTTAVTEAEVLYGIEIMPAGKRRRQLSEAIEKLFADEFQDRILPFDADAAHIFPKIVAARERIGRRIAQFDAMIAAIVHSRHAVLATRNVNDFEHCGIQMANPWNC